MPRLTASAKEIASLKSRARRALQDYHYLTAGLDCGAAMAQYVSTEAARTAAEFDSAMRMLAEIDPDCPAWRPLTAGALP